MGEPKRITGGVLRYFFTILQGIDPDLTVITPGNGVRLKQTGCLETTSQWKSRLLFCRTLKQLSRHNDGITRHTHARNDCFSWTVSEVVLDREQALEHSIEGPVGCCTT